MGTMDDTIIWLIALLNPLSIYRSCPPTQDLLRFMIKKYKDGFKPFYTWEKHFQKDVMQLDLDIVQFYYSRGFLDKETLMEGRLEIKTWIMEQTKQK